MSLECGGRTRLCEGRSATLRAVPGSTPGKDNRLTGLREVSCEPAREKPHGACLLQRHCRDGDIIDPQRRRPASKTVRRNAHLERTVDGPWKRQRRTALIHDQRSALPNLNHAIGIVRQQEVSPDIDPTVERKRIAVLGDCLNLGLSKAFNSA